ncbi:MAG: HisA/HisF-related TIM barrel protein [Nitrospinota bacterium]|nr:HisA/HisF-related TIM barrel protein [Nitrospinota bacterium]
MDSPKLIPVMDLMGGLLVRATGGVRADYRPVQSPLLASADPVNFVKVFQKRLGSDTFYLADLNAIMGLLPNSEVIKALLEQTSATFWLDGGYKRMESVPQGNERIVPIIATETYLDWDCSPDLSATMVSIDTFHGRFYCARAGMPLQKVLASARAAQPKGLIHMRLDSVGAGDFNQFKLIPPRQGEVWYAAGGIRGPEDMLSVGEAGYVGALVSTALLEGKL